MFSTVSAIACIHWYWMPELNPYRPAQSIIVLLLVGGLVGWRRLRPVPSPFTAAYMSVAWIVMICGVFAMTESNFDAPETACGVVLKASLVLTVFIYVELGRTWHARRRLRIAQAAARYQPTGSS